MTDRELLALAGLAGNIPKRVIGAEGGIYNCDERGWHRAWNPLTNDGDALRLAVKLGIEIILPAKTLEVSSASATFQGQLIHEMRWIDEDAEEPDFQEAARRNIVSVAAAIGASIKNNP